MPDDPPEAPMLRELRHALQDLYDPGRLRTNLLAHALGLGPPDGPAALRRVLVQAIEALEPEASASPHSDAWRTYRTLTHRYVDQFSQQEVAATLGLSIRQMRRQEALALRVLADYLTSQYDLRPDAFHAAEGSPTAGDTPPQGPASHPEQELEWLERSFPSQVIDAAELVQPLLKVVAPLAGALRVQITCSLPQDLPRLAVQTASSRQALLNLLTAAILSAAGGQVTIGATTGGGQVGIEVTPARRGATAEPLAGEQLDNLEMARKLATLSGGSLLVAPGEDSTRPFAATLRLPSVEQAAVLFIDDNADTQQLYQRYLSGSRYLYIGVRDPQQALASGEGPTPKAIVLDIMLPGMDGWELLERLREHPLTRDVPIVVCTVLPQEALALSLGAAALLRKPVSRTALLSALDSLLGPPSPGCR